MQFALYILLVHRFIMAIITLYNYIMLVLIKFVWTVIIMMYNYFTINFTGAIFCGYWLNAIRIVKSSLFLCNVTCSGDTQTAWMMQACGTCRHATSVDCMALA